MPLRPHLLTGLFAAYCLSFFILPSCRLPSLLFRVTGGWKGLRLDAAARVPHHQAGRKCTFCVELAQASEREKSRAAAGKYLRASLSLF